MTVTKTASSVGTASRLSLFVALTLAAPLSRALAADDVTGEWEMKMNFNDRESFATLSIAKKADGTLAGKWGSSELSSVKLDGGKLTFARTVRFGDQEFTLEYEGTLKEGKLTGTQSSDRGNFSANGARPKPRHPILGRWALKYAIGDREIEATLAVSESSSGALDAKWTTATGEHTVSNVKLQDGKLSLARKSKIGEREFESTYEASVQGHKITGVIKRAEGETPANGTRADADLVGKWEMASTSDRGPRTSMLTVFGDLTGRYETFGGEVPFKDLKIEGGDVTFSLESGFGDQTFTLTFKGKLDGKSLKGEVTSPRGTREVTGKKIEAPSAAAAVVGTWEITREGSQGARTSTLAIKADLSGTYTFREQTAPITDLRVEGDQLSFKVVVKFEDREVPMEFKGKIEGATLKGQFTTPRGTREATGKKVGEGL